MSDDLPQAAINAASAVLIQHVNQWHPGHLSRGDIAESMLVAASEVIDCPNAGYARLDTPVCKSDCAWCGGTGRLRIIR